MPTAVNELLYAAAVVAANSDPHRPKVILSITPAIEWYGYHKRGSQWNVGNPDSLYRYIPIEGESSYEICVNNRAPGPANTAFFVWDAFMSENSKRAITSVR